MLLIEWVSIEQGSGDFGLFVVLQEDKALTGGHLVFTEAVLDVLFGDGEILFAEKLDQECCELGGLFLITLWESVKDNLFAEVTVELWCILKSLWVLNFLGVEVDCRSHVLG